MVGESPFPNVKIHRGKIAEGHFMKTNYIVTGPTGSIGKFFVKNLKGKDLISAKIDYSDKDAVTSLLSGREGRNVIFHTAFKGVRDYKNSTQEDYDVNMKMYRNIKSCLKEGDILYNFGSGIAMMPDDGSWYQKAKRDIYEDIMDTPLKNVMCDSCKGCGSKPQLKREMCDKCNGHGWIETATFDVTLYGLFSPSEDPSRFVSQMISGFLDGGLEADVTITDKLYSFASYKDVFDSIMLHEASRDRDKEIIIGSEPRWLSEYAGMIAREMINLGHIEYYSMLIDGIGDDYSTELSGDCLCSSFEDEIKRLLPKFIKKHKKRSLL